MNKRVGAGIAFFSVGIALMVAFKFSTVGISTGVVFLILGIVMMLKNRAK